MILFGFINYQNSASTQKGLKKQKSLIQAKSKRLIVQQNGEILYKKDMKVKNHP